MLKVVGPRVIADTPCSQFTQQQMLGVCSEVHGCGGRGQTLNTDVTKWIASLLLSTCLFGRGPSVHALRYYISVMCDVLGAKVHMRALSSFAASGQLYCSYCSFKYISPNHHQYESPVSCINANMVVHVLCLLKLQYSIHCIQLLALCLLQRKLSL